MSNKDQMKNVGLIVAVILLIGSLIGNAVYMKSNRDMKARMDKELLHEDSVLAVKMMLDKELDEAKAELDQYKGQNAQLDKMLAEARTDLDNKEQKIKMLISQNATVKNLRKQLADLMKLRTQQEAQIQKLLAENKNLKTELTTTQGERDQLKTVNDDLNKKVQQAGILRAQSISVEFARERGDKVKQTLKVNRANHIIVNVELGDNPLAASGNKQVYLLVYGPDNKVLGAGSNKFTKQETGEELAYTMAKTVDYANTSQKVRFDYDAGGRLEKGNYKFEVYVDGAYGGKYDFAMN